jgi:hypothetical protein
METPGQAQKETELRRECRELKAALERQTELAKRHRCALTD